MNIIEALDKILIDCIIFTHCNPDLMAEKAEKKTEESHVNGTLNSVLLVLFLRHAT